MPIGETQQLLLSHAPAVRQYIESRIPFALRRELDADDILHDVWTRVLRSHNLSFVSGVLNVEHYLMRVASTVLVDRLRKKQAAKRGGGRNAAKMFIPKDWQTSYANLFERVAGSRRTPSSEIAVREAASAIQIAMERIPEFQREAIELHHIHGLSYAEVGERLSRSEHAVQGLLTRGMRKLKAQLGTPGQYLSDAPSDAD